jgi:hypothetical protein
LNRADELPSRVTGRALTVKRTLQQQRSRRLINYLSSVPGIAAAFAERGMGEDGSKSLINEPDGSRRDQWDQLGSECTCHSGSPARFPG